MRRQIHILRFVLTLLALIGAGASPMISRADTPIYGADVRGLYIGSRTSNVSGLNPFMVINISSQSSYWDTGGGTHQPWSYISGTVSVGSVSNVPFSGTVRWGGRMDISYWNGLQYNSYTAWIMNDGWDYETTSGTFTTTQWLYIPYYGWLSFQVDNGSFYVFRW